MLEIKKVGQLAGCKVRCIISKQVSGDDGSTRNTPFITTRGSLEPPPGESRVHTTYAPTRHVFNTPPLQAPAQTRPGAMARGAGPAVHGGATKLTWWHGVLIVLMLVTGSTNTLSKKIAYQSQSTGLDGETKKFHKPWSLTLVM